MEIILGPIDQTMLRQRNCQRTQSVSQEKRLRRERNGIGSREELQG